MALRPGMGVRALAKALGVAHSSLSWRLKRLKQLDAIPLTEAERSLLDGHPALPPESCALGASAARDAAGRPERGRHLARYG
jgi:hypothetical protein